MILSEKNVLDLMQYCILSKEEERKYISGPQVIVCNGINFTAYFDAKRLGSVRSEVQDLFNQLPDLTHGELISTLFFTKNKDTLWTEVTENVECLVLLGLGSGLIEWSLPRDFWNLLPNSEPIVETKKNT
jgi:hypothetical protein